MASGAVAASPCDGCDARCCGAYTVTVTGADAHCISRGIGLEMVRFLAYLPEVERSDGGFLLEVGGPTYRLILGSVDTSGHGASCVFLRVDAVTGAGRCGVYPFRPSACRRFPAVRVDGRAVVARGGIVCPPGAWEGHAMERLSWRVALQREQREAEVYAAVVAGWNARVEAGGRGRAWTAAQYLDHVRDAYAWLDGLRRILPPAERRGEALLGRVREAWREGPCP